MLDSDPNRDGNTTDSESTFYQYDLFWNLLSIALPDGRTIEYEVDGAGRRVGRRELDPDGNELSFRGWIYRDLLRPIAEVNSAGEVVARYVYSDGEGSRQNGVSQLATRLGANQDTSLPFSGSNVPEAIELLDASGAVTQTLMLSTNQVGSVQLVTDAATGSVVQRIEYDEFGRVLTDSAPGMQPFGFAGGLYDSATNLVRFGARDYDSVTGRWVARDPVRFAGGSNLLAYLRGDGINGMDVAGFFGVPGGATGAVIGCIFGATGSLGGLGVKDALDDEPTDDGGSCEKDSRQREREVLKEAVKGCLTGALAGAVEGATGWGIIIMIGSGFASGI
jgi:RHS repeat-associated protein